MSELLNTRARVGFGIANVVVAVGFAIGIFRLLPMRWWLVDTGGVVVIALMGASGLALLAKHRTAERITRIAAFAVLAIGLALFATLCLTASWLHGVYGPVGRGGAAIFALVAALVLPYVVLLPIAELLWIGPRACSPSPARSPKKDGDKKKDESKDQKKNDEDDKNDASKDQKKNDASKDQKKNDEDDKNEQASGKTA